MRKNKYRAYLVTLSEALKEYALEAKKTKDLAVGSDNEEFATGYLCGFYRTITLMQQHAESYGINLKELNLADIKDIDLI